MSRMSNLGNKATRSPIGLILSAILIMAVPTISFGQVRLSSSALIKSLADKRINNFKASFSYSPRYPSDHQPVQFLDSSSGSVASWLWDFGDGTTSAERNPVHMYAAPGFRKVTLTIANAASSKKVTRTLTIMPAVSPASFIFSPMTPAPGQTVQFQDTTSGDPTSWNWNFGDGEASTLKNPSHVFAKAGSYTVSLTAANSSGSKYGSNIVTVANMSILTSSFAYTPGAPSQNQSIQFTDTSAGSPTSWQWTFGDGTSSTAQNPTHAYATAGAKTVTLTVTNGSGSNSASRTITVAASLSASFSFIPSSPVEGQSVQFTDTSAGSPTSWQWDFGDGTSGNVQNPSHIYATAGSYIISLTVLNGSTQSSTTRPLSIGPTNMLTASFIYNPVSPTVGQTVQFTDTSTGNPTSWQWDFNDGTRSTTKNPIHAFEAPGSYYVTLTVGNGSTVKNFSTTVAVAPSPKPTASFTFSPVSPSEGQIIQFTDTSTGAPDSWEWDFGDGGTSVSQNPSHAYKLAGSYSITLNIKADTTLSSTHQTISVRQADTVMAASPSLADVTLAISTANAGDTVVVPAGSATWSSGLVIRKGIQLMGAGIGETIITNAQSGNLITYNPSDYSLNTPFRLSGFSWNMAGSGRWMALGAENKAAPFTIQDKVRIDHNRVYNPGNVSAQIIWNYCCMFGVVDSNVFEGINYGFKADTQGTEYGWWQTAPQNEFQVGSNRYLYFEDNTITMVGTDNCLQEGQYSGRFAWRYNTITGAYSYSLWELHGHQTSGNMGSCFGAEVYGNQVTWTGSGAVYFMKIRGGQSMVFCNNNTSTGTVSVSAYTSLITVAAVSPELQLIHDTYMFQNRHSLTGSDMHITAEGSLSYGGLTGIPQLGREVMTNVTSPGVTAGPLAKRPSNPVPHQAYWATEQSTTDLTGMVGRNPAVPIRGTLYICRTPGIWEEYYTPYAYPHPLRNGQ